MHGSILLVTMPSRAHPRGFTFFFLFWRSVPPGHTEETIPHPRAPDRPPIRFCYIFLSVQKQSDTFSQLLWLFSWVYWEKDNGCHNVVKTWTINLKNEGEKPFKKRFLDRTLNWISVSPYTAISIKVVGKSARDNPEGYCGWFLVHCSSKKFQRMAQEAMDVCLRVLKQSKKSRFDSCSVRNSILIISRISFRDCRVHIFPYNLSRNSCISKALYSFSYKSLSLFKAKLKKYFRPSFPENKLIHSSTHNTHIVSNFKTYL